MVRCGHCKQAHLWVAPDRVEAQGPPPAARRAGGGASPMLVVAAAAAGVLIVAGVGAAMLLRVKPRLAAEDRSLPPDAPLVLGDRLEMAVQTKSSFQSCSFDVLGLEADGRVLGVPCGGTTPAPVSRALLRSESYQSADPGSIALYRGPSGWVRAEVIGPEPGDQVRLRALGEAGAESVAPKSQVFGVQRGGFPAFVQAPLPAAAPLEVGDLILRRDGAMLEEGKLLAVGDAVRYERGSAHDGRFEAFKEEPKTASRQMLLGRVVSAGTKLEPGNVVLAPAGTSWQRLSVVVEEPHYLLKVRAAGGSEQSIMKQGLFLIRVADKAPPEPPAAAGSSSSVAPLMRGFRQCFQEALAKNPKAQGKVEARLEVGPKGDVTKAEMTPSGDLPPSVAPCMKRHALATKLPPPAGGATVMLVPVVFQAS